MTIILNILFALYAFLYLPYLLLSGRWYKGFGMRFGLLPADIHRRLAGQSHLWLHAVSVGEVMAIEPLVRQLSAQKTGYPLVLTVTTKTGYALAKERFPDMIVLPSPLDFTFTVQHFINAIKPKIYVAAETEIWPNLFHALSKNNCPIVVVNGRISDRSIGRYESIKFFLKPILGFVRIWGMQSQIDADRIIGLGADPTRVRVMGNVKFDDATQSANVAVPPLPSGFLWFIAGSTHPGEEEIILKAAQQLRQQGLKWRVVIAPRHVDRCRAVEALVSSYGLTPVLFSKFFSSASPSDAVIIVDTIGQLRSLYACADLVFVGKSLCVGGGHNIIEPAFFSKAIMIGPMMANFRDITACFKSAGALIQVPDEKVFLKELVRLANDAEARQALGQKAYAVIKNNQGATKRAIEMIKSCL